MEFYTVLKAKIDWQYCDTGGMEWAKKFAAAPLAFRQRSPTFHWGHHLLSSVETIIVIVVLVSFYQCTSSIHVSIYTPGRHI